MAKIDVISSCLVSMSNNGHPIAISTMELTPWDLRFLLLDPIQKGILFYKPESPELEKTIIHHLKKSLSHTLGFFPPLAGRLGTIKNEDSTTCFFVDCNDAGAEFTHAVAGAVSVSDILEARACGWLLYRLHSKSCRGRWDFFLAFLQFLVRDIARFRTISKTPVFERWFPSNIANNNRLIPLPPLEQNLFHNFVPPALLQRVFHFSKESVAKLKAKANSEAGSKKISSLQALSAHLWRSAIRCRHPQSYPSSQEFYFFLLIDARARIPLPEGYFGNAVYGARTATSEHELLRNGLGYTALKINELVTQQTSEAAIKFVEHWVKNPTTLRKGNTAFVITSSPRYNVYGNDFGWGKPIAVRSGKGQNFDGRMTVLPAAVHGDIDVEVCLALETLQAIEDDAEFMEAVTI
ncbi:hypothetical protein Pfo_011345 [Paulownia fortunei]|nr:hypothetical protein Pfo_011345 [Paulownia fortunei]